MLDKITHEVYTTHILSLFLIKARQRYIIEIYWTLQLDRKKYIKKQRYKDREVEFFPRNDCQ